MNTEPKPWTVALFERYRNYMTLWIIAFIVPLLDNGVCRRIVVRAPVKSGKREIVEYIAMRDADGGSGTSSRVHAFLSAWHRAADDAQREELKLHNLKVFSITKKNAADDCIRWILGQIQLGKTVVIHLDECDHGSGDRQILGKVYKRIRDLLSVFTILYSATPQEVLFSNDITGTATNNDSGEAEMLDDMVYGESLEYTPPLGYCGPGRFLDAGLVIEAKPFFRTVDGGIELTAQGIEFIEGLKAATASGSGRNIATLRLTRKMGRTKAGKEIYKFLQNSHRIPQLQGVQIWVDKGDCDWGNARKIEWSSPDYWRTTAKDVPILIVMDQTSSRSTEWACHDRIYATHDYRTSQQYAILSQAQERVNHYDSKYASGFQPIRVYGHKKTFELSAGRINYEQYFACEWLMRKVDVRTANARGLGEVYDIKNSTTGARHPQYLEPLGKAAAEAVLEELGCIGDVSLSNRVRGDVRRLPVFDTHWFPCNMVNWDTAIAAVLASVGDGLLAGRNFDNPFLNASRPPAGEDGRELGYLRGWKVLDYDTQILGSDRGWGVGLGAPRVTICYSGGVLGAAVRWHTGRFEEGNRLTAYRSMYPGR